MIFKMAKERLEGRKNYLVTKAKKAFNKVKYVFRLNAAFRLHFVPEMQRLIQEMDSHLVKLRETPWKIEKIVPQGIVRVYRNQQCSYYMFEGYVDRKSFSPKPLLPMVEIPADLESYITPPDGMFTTEELLRIQERAQEGPLRKLVKKYLRQRKYVIQE